jgi:hypothetical protein
MEVSTRRSALRRQRNSLTDLNSVGARNPNHVLPVE